jgi:DHA1 family quinolone resistance protein-like MFS transporter
MNRVLKFLMISDILVLTGFGLIDPILAIFFKENLVGGSILAAGIAGAIFLFVKSIVQLPFSRRVDKFTNKNRLKWLIVGSLIISLVPFIYLFVTHVYFLFLIQAIYGLGSGLAYPTWLGLWTTHLDKKKESFEWSLYSTITNLGVALTAGIGAVISEFIGFHFTFVFVGIISLVGCAILFNVDRRKHKIDIFMDLNYQKKRKLANVKGSTV